MGLSNGSQPGAWLSRFLALALVLTLKPAASGEIIFQDFFNNGGGEATASDISNSVPFIDVQGDGWQTPPPVATPLALDGSGHVFNPDITTSSASVPLTPIGPFGRLIATASLQLPVSGANWIGLGFGNGNEPLGSPGSLSGPWVRVNNDGSAVFYGGANTNYPISLPNAFVNTGSPITFSLTYDAFHKSATLVLASANGSNVFLETVAVTNSAQITARYLGLQFSATATVLSNRWIGPVAVDWIPRPPPMLTLPVAISSIVTNQVGITNGNSIKLIQAALSRATATNKPLVIQFTAGATYTITTTSTNAYIPLTLSQATNVVLDGNGCKIIIQNPRIGFLHINACSNVIVKGFTVDYDPLPYTQGIVTRNLYTEPSGTPAAAIEFRPETGYPAPTNANYVDKYATNATTGAERWGTIMNTNYPGRGADDRHTIYAYRAVTATNSGQFIVSIPTIASLTNIQTGDYWCMVSRWNGSSVYSAANSYQVTFLDLTNYAGAAANFEATATPLLSEVECHVEIGPPPAGATHTRIKSSNADGGYFGYTRIGPWVADCVFTGLSDDVANAYANPFVITNTIKGPTNTFTIRLYGDGGGKPTAVTAYYFQVGDRLAFFNALTGVIFDRATVTNVSLPKISVDHPVAGIVRGTYQTNTLVFNLSLNDSAVYVNNQFSNSRIHGIYCRANNMLIAHNEVTGMGLSAISGFPALDLGSPNAFVPTNVVIMDNVLSDCSYTYDAIHNDIPTNEPAFALVELHQTRYNSDYVTNTFGISGIRILNNAFLNWRRAPLSLHNVSDCRVIGNYFGPPLTNDDLVPLASDYIADLWSCDYSSLDLSANVNATTLSDEDTIKTDGSFTTVTNAYAPLIPPLLSFNLGQTNTVINWPAEAPAFVLQQCSALDGEWMDTTNLPRIMGISNMVTLPLPAHTGQDFYRVRQR